MVSYYSNRIVKTVFLELWFQEVTVHNGGGSRKLKTVFLNYSHEAEALKVQVLHTEMDFSSKATSLGPP